MDQEGLLQGETPVWGWTKTKYHVWGDLLMLGGGRMAAVGLDGA